VADRRVDAAFATARQRRTRSLRELAAWLAIPSISADPRRAGDVRRAAEWLAEWLRSRRADVSVLATDAGPPVVLGRVPGPPAAPVVLVYGHYDVQPPGPGWSRPPFVPRVQGGVLYARGANDDKGQLFSHLAAIDAWIRTGGPPVTVMILAEGAEEIGSPGFAPVAAELRRRTAPDVIVVSDTERASWQRPSITISQRGHVALRVTVDTGGEPVHAGRFGGAVLDPTLILSRVLTTVANVIDTVPAAMRPGSGMIVEGRTDAAIRHATGGRATPFDALEQRITQTSAISITAIHAGGSAGAVPTRATASLDVRLAPGVHPAPTIRRIQRVIRTHLQRGVHVQVEVAATSRGLDHRIASGVRRAAEQACLDGFGTRPAYVRSGGTIPAVPALTDSLGRTPLLLGLGTPQGHAHGPDERLDLEGWERGVNTCIAFFNRISSRQYNSPEPCGDCEKSRNIVEAVN
jgi:succinyl-diaminopimelate desuccinylase